MQRADQDGREAGGGGGRVGVPGWLAAALLVLTACRPEEPAAPAPIPVRVEAVQDLRTVEAQRGAAYLATVKGRNQITLSFRVPGIVELVGPGKGEWEEGASVTNGQLLARLQQSDFIANFKSAEAQAQLERTQFERAERLLRDGAASQQEYDRALASKEASKAALEGRRQELQDSLILAPFQGTVLKREVKAGETVGAGTPIITVADLSEVEIEVGVPDRLVGRLQVGNAVPVSLSGLGDETFSGVVREVGVAAREGTRLFRVVVRVPNPSGRIRPGMAASVYLDAAARTTTGGVLARLSALVARNERDLAVFVVSNGVARLRPVTTGDLRASSIVLTSGVQPGEAVVVAGASQLHDGAEVDARPFEPEPNESALVQ